VLHQQQIIVIIIICVQVMIRMTNLETKHEWIWPREKFLNRKCIMQEMHNNFQEGEDWDVPPVS
jgi:hypothetical protein